MATSVDHKAFENLSKTIANLMQHVKDKDAEIAALKKCINEHSNCSHNTSKCNQGSYCWMHGYLVHGHHNSENCQNPAPGHQKEATRDNPMGGNMEGAPNKNDK